MDYIKHSLAFISAVVTNWAGYTTGGVIVAFLALYTLIKDVPIPRKWGIGITLFFLLLAFFTAWRTEYLKTHPGLVIRVLEMRRMPVQNSNETGLVIVASISNVGAPTIADTWRIRVKESGGGNWSDYVGYYLVDQTRPIEIQIEGIPFRVFYNPIDSINLRTSQPLPTGTRINGLLVTRVKSDFSNLGKGAAIEIQCEDVSRNKISGV